MKELARWLVACFEVSARRACQVVRLSRSTWLYQSRREEQVALKQRIRDIAETRTRYGYLRIHALLLREGWQVNRKRIYRLYCEMGLQMRHKTPRRRVKAKLREDRQPARCRNDCWSMDFMTDQTFDGDCKYFCVNRRLHIVNQPVLKLNGMCHHENADYRGGPAQ